MALKEQTVKSGKRKYWWTEVICKCRFGPWRETKMKIWTHQGNVDTLKGWSVDFPKLPCTKYEADIPFRAVVLEIK